MTRNKAIAQATSESSIYRQGAGWVLSTYDPGARCNRVCGEMHYGAARQDLADWRVGRALELLGMGDDLRAMAYSGIQSGGRIADRVSAIMASRKPYQTPRVKWSRERASQDSR